MSLLQFTVATAVVHACSAAGDDTIGPAVVKPNPSGFGATVTGFDIHALLETGSDSTKLKFATELKASLHEHRYLHFPGQTTLQWQDQLAWVELLGET